MTTARSIFALEALEPRVLLSGTMPVGPAPLAAPTPVASPVEEHPLTDEAPAGGAALAYDPAAQLDDIFATSDTQQHPAPGQPASSPEASDPHQAEPRYITQASPSPVA